MTHLTPYRKPELAIPDDPLAALADFLRLDVAQGDASPETVRSYYGQVAQWLAWCQEQGLDPALATEEQVKSWRAHLVSQGYARATIATKLATVRRFYDMAVSRGWRPDNPAAGIRAPAERTARSERVKWLPLEAVRRLLGAPDSDTLKGKRDRAILTLMLLHGLRVTEVAGLSLAHLDMEAGTVTVHGKGSKLRTLLLVDLSRHNLLQWLAVRHEVARDDALFVSLKDNRTGKPGTALDRRGMRKIVDSYLEATGLKREGLSCHALRHSHATLARAAGAKLDAISRALATATSPPPRYTPIS